MPTPASSLSVAIQAVADFLAEKMADDVVVTVDVPQRAQKQVEGENKHYLNIFVYRIAPSGFHADMTDEQPTFIRASILLTAFPAGQGDPPPDSDLRVLGQAVRVLQSFPTIPAPLPGGAPAGAAHAQDFRHGGANLTEYRLQAVMQAPTMEELNHIWTTQGGELAYRLSAAYEVALIPIEPLSYADPAPRVQAGELETVPGNIHSPFQMFFDQGRLYSHHQVAAGSVQTDIAVTAPPNTRVSAVVRWTRANGNTDVQAVQIFEIKTPDINSADARFILALVDTASGDQADIQTTLLDANGEPAADVPPANPIKLVIGA